MKVECSRSGLGSGPEWGPNMIVVKVDSRLPHCECKNSPGKTNN